LRIVVALLALGLTSCSPHWRGYDEVTGQARTLSSEKLPDGQHFAGSYWSPQVGTFELREPSAGKIEATVSWSSGVDDGGACTLTRMLAGDSKDNLASFDWTEKLSDGCGAARAGHGRFFYGFSDDQSRLFASWWLGDDSDNFENWTAYRRGDAR
jgi:hypothetical protein